MGTKVQCKSCLPGYYSMRDLNEDSSSSSWPLFYGDNTVTNGQYFNGFIPRTTIDDHPGYEKDALKQKMLEHETVFRNQVHELHRLYRIQRDMMEEVKRKGLHQRASIEPSSSSSSLRGSQKPSEDARKWHMGGFPMTNSAYGRTTILGVEVANSPMSCTIGNDTQPSQFPFKNGSSSKDREGLDSRPLKVRKKLFDLHRPAEEYADTEEGGNIEDNSTTSPKTSVKLILDNQAGVKFPINASASDCRFRGSIGLADLNEPFQYEESVALPRFDFHGRHSTNGDTKWMNQFVKSSAGHLGAIHDGFLLNSPIGSKVNERDRFSYFYEAGYNKCNLSPMSQALRQDKFPRLNPVNHPSGLYPSVCGTQDLWRDNPHHGAEFLEKSRDLSHTCFSSPFTSSRTHSASSLAKSKNDFTQKLTTFEPPFNSAAVVDRSFQPFSQTRDEPFFGGKSRVDASSRLHPGLESEGKVANGFYHGSASGSKETQALLPSAGFDYLKNSKDDKVVSDRLTNHGFGIFAKHKSCHKDSKPVLDINLNEVVSTSPNELVIVEDLNMTHGKIKPEYHLPALPWLRPKPDNDNRRCLNYVPDFSNELCPSRETVGDLNQPSTTTDSLAPSDCRVIEKNLNAEARNVQKILGFPIFAAVAPKEVPTSLVSSSTTVNYAAEKKIVITKRENRIIDINIECEPDEQIADEDLTLEKPTKNTCFIDLNSCASDCEDPPVPSFESKNNSVKVILEIDLEAPVFLESEDVDAEAKENVPEDVSFPVSENNAEPIHDEVLQNAADAMLAMSSSCPRVNISEASLTESLLWFVNAMSLCSVELEHVSGKESRAGAACPQQEFSKKTDEFEAMVLQLVETKKEDFMPKPFISELPIEENGGTSNMLATRSRRGHSRRGRQRKDFQRDILPGLTSLSRHEMTEDLQTFGGIMKATGHQWNSGLTRRNGTRNSGGARGRRRVVVETVTTTVPSTVCAPLIPQPNAIKSGLENRSLTGWGKTTRRPRRQRFPAGNTPTIAST